jgi:hypothetical protein
MMTMNDLFESMETAQDEAEFFEAILAADDDLLDEVFDEEDVERLAIMAQLIGAAEAGALSEDQDDMLEGFRSWMAKKKTQIANKLPPGAKMVFGKIVKGGKVLGQAAKATARGVQAGARGVQAGARKVVAAKRAVQGAAYRFTDAGKKARAASKKLSDTKGRKAGDAAWKASKETYKKHIKGGESHTYATAQAQKAGARFGGEKPKAKAKPTQPVAAEKPKPKAGKGKRKKSAVVRTKGEGWDVEVTRTKKPGTKKRKPKMEDVFAYVQAEA